MSELGYDADFDLKGHADRMLLAVSILAESVDLEQITAVVATAHSLAPLLDPTAYRDALYRGDMDAIARLAAALKEPVRVFNSDIAPKMPPRVGLVSS